MGKSLVIVESPAKAKTINKFLGKDFIVIASVGHLKDLPKSKLGIDIENGFEPFYETIKGKANTLKELKKAGKTAEKIFLAPDPDREGEAIAWHIADEIDKGRKKTFRVLFNEITEKAVTDAIAHPTVLDQHKFEAQQARRILDRLVGYQVSPILWDKVRRGLSAGRVQSVAVRLICDREREIQAFVPKEYWSETAEFAHSSGGVFKAKLAKKDGKKFEINNEQESDAVLSDLKGASYSVDEVEKKETKRNPAAPFITSKLQQEASRKLGYTAKKTMMLAQQLYEGVDIGEDNPVGLISYMRTDSTRVSNEAVASARELISAKYGEQYLPAKPNIYKSKKKSQDAHEAIRPTYFQYTPESVAKHLSKDQLKLYQLIWNRFIACQMNPAIIDQTRVQIGAKGYTFNASGSSIKFPGFMAVYIEGQDVEEEKEEAIPPSLAKGDALKLIALLPEQHFTQPPPRFTEATLVKELEENGIGRPSTYAAIISTIQDREYVIKDKTQLKPTELGFMVTDLLVVSFPEILDVEFTAHMEEELDSIEEGQLEWRKAMEEFYGPFRESLEKAKKDMKNVKAEEVPTDIVCEKCSRHMVIKWGRKGKFLACSGYPECKNTKDFETDEHGKVVVVVRAPETTDTPCPKCSKPMTVKSGRFGKFLACSDYPDCKSTLPYSTGIPCPNNDEGMLVERRTKKGRTFYGCSKYPKCDYATWELPKAE
ncbi:MAG: type I DNA topoisomerase [Deltaproteobacteria bacterium]